MSQQSTNGTSRGALLSNTVSSLVRAQYGLTARSENESTTDLDKHVAELLLQEAREREARAKASNSTHTAWSFSDDEDGNSNKQYTSRTNKRFLKNMLKGVEEHNAPLRRKEESTNRESLDDIRKREREARERRTGVRDAERAGKSNGMASASTTASDQRRPVAAGPGFAARMLANGLSGALASREEKSREEKGIRSAIDAARKRAERDRDGESSGSHSHREDRREGGSSRKGKERERDYSDNDQYHGRLRRSSREREERHRSSRHRSSRDYSSDRSDEGRRERRKERHRERSRSRSPRATTTKLRKDERHSWHGHSRHESDRRRQKDGDKDSKRGRDRSRSHSADREHDSREKQPKRRSISRDSSSLSEHASDASSDTFIDYTGATDVAESSTATGGGSKMDKYFSSNYNPALDISVADLEDPKTGLIGEGNFSEWDKMLHTLKKRKEDKLTGATQAREEERERQLRKMERRRRREERELRHALKKEKKRKKRRRSESESNSDSDIGPKESSSSRKARKRSKEPGTVVIDGFEYGKRGSTRAWDLGKGSTPC